MADARQEGPKLDTSVFAALTEESRDLHVDGEPRRAVLSRIGHGAGGGVVRALLGGGFGGLLAGLVAAPARADVTLDVQILQTASSLEALAVATYAAALGEGPDKADAPAAKAIDAIAMPSVKATLTAFAKETQRQHAEHKKAFQAQTTALGGKVQDAPNPKFLAAVTAADLSTAVKLVDFAATLEKVATDTYLLNLSMLQDQRSKAIMASVMAVESQHLATLRAVSALLGAGAAGAAFVAVPFPIADLMKLPTVAGTVAFPDALHKVSGPELVAEPTSGAAA